MELIDLGESIVSIVDIEAVDKTATIRRFKNSYWSLVIYYKMDGPGRFDQYSVDFDTKGERDAAYAQLMRALSEREREAVSYTPPSTGVSIRHV